MTASMPASYAGPHWGMVSPALEQVAPERAGSLKLVKVDVDKNATPSRRSTGRAVPARV